MSDATSVLERIKPHTTSLLNLAGTLVLAGVLGYGNMRSGSTHSADIQQQQQVAIERQQKQLDALEEQVNQQKAVLAVLGEFKQDTQTRLDRIEGKIDRELQFHRGK